MAKNYPDERRIAFAELIFKGKSCRVASEEIGIPFETGKEWLTRPDVKAMIANCEAKAVAKFEKKAIYSRQELLEDYLKIARTPASETNGSLTNQLNALNAIRDTLGWVGKDFISGSEEETPKGPKIYQPEWMREAHA